MNFGQSLMSGEINFATGAVWVLAALVFSSAAGALSAMKLAGKDIGNELALMMGSAFGPLAAVPSVLIGLIILKFI
ncbi:MAG: hypothetical protein JST89_10040 [Cyanobacteria bacterium SZAS-4]|nr:hypothetical protein [Cyanobacteria bacterium SZAS-4]